MNNLQKYVSFAVLPNVHNFLVEDVMFHRFLEAAVHNVVDYAALIDLCC